jgi:hypothetical protein
MAKKHEWPLTLFRDMKANANQPSHPMRQFVLHIFRLIGSDGTWDESRRQR